MADEERTWCAVCGVDNRLNPIADHKAWLGHEWTPRTVPGRVEPIDDALTLMRLGIDLVGRMN